MLAGTVGLAQGSGSSTRLAGPGLFLRKEQRALLARARAEAQSVAVARQRGTNEPPLPQSELLSNLALPSALYAQPSALAEDSGCRLVAYAPTKRDGAAHGKAANKGCKSPDIEWQAIAVCLSMVRNDGNIETERCNSHPHPGPGDFSASASKPCAKPRTRTWITSAAGHVQYAEGGANAKAQNAANLRCRA